MRARLRTLGVWLDQRPIGWAGAVGLAGGAAMGTLLLWEPTPLRAGLCVGLTLASIPLAWFAGPRVREEPAVPAPQPASDRKRSDEERKPPVDGGPSALLPSGSASNREPEPNRPVVPPSGTTESVAPDPPIVEPVGSREPPPSSPPVATVLDMVPLEGGRFWMGSPNDDKLAYSSKKPRHEVEVGAFAIARVPTTRAHYAAILGGEEPPLAEAQLPVTEVLWFDAVAFCNRLSEREGRELAYEVHGTEVSWNPAANGYRLPTEAEWEYAARAGTSTAWSFGDDESQVGEYAWRGENSGNRARPVGTKKANPWGLHDMHGNVWEWCWDWFGSYPTVPVSGSDRVLRGGSFIFDPRDLRSALRGRFRPEFRDVDVGFRCVLGSRREP